jgi:hypothetical protein
VEDGEPPTELLVVLALVTPLAADLGGHRESHRDFVAA